MFLARSAWMLGSGTRSACVTAVAGAFVRNMCLSLCRCCGFWLTLGPRRSEFRASPVSIASHAWLSAGTMWSITPASRACRDSPGGPRRCIPVWILGDSPAVALGVLPTSRLQLLRMAVCGLPDVLRVPATRGRADLERLHNAAHAARRSTFVWAPLVCGFYCALRSRGVLLGAIGRAGAGH